MLRRLPRVLGLALRRAEAGGPRALHALQGSAAEERDNGSSRLRAAFSVSALAAGSALMSTSTRAAAEEAASVAKPADMLQGLKSLADAKEIVLYQYEVCPFCNKLKAFLDFHKIPYRVVEVNPLSKKELKWSTYGKVPVLTVDGEQLNDSSFIIKALNAKLQQAKGRYARSPSAAAAEEEERWFSWVDGRLVHVLTPNIYRTVAEAFQTFDYITKTGNFGFMDRELARWSGVAIMYTLSHTRLKKRHNITDERQALYEEVGKWTTALGDRKFMGGEQPNLADLAFFGVLRAVKGFDTHRDVMANTTLEPWFSRMEAAVGASSRIASA